MLVERLDLDSAERSDLANVVSSPGFKVFLKLAAFVVEQARTDLDNADPANPSEVMAKHALSKASSLFHGRLINCINNEVSQYVDAPKKSDKPVDSTEALFDDLEAQVADLPNFLGEPIVIEESPEEGY